MSRHASPIAPARLLPVLATMAALGSMAVHMLVPALPLLAREFAISPRTAQQAISFYLIGLSAGQLACGPLADRFGRRPVILGGLALYTFGAIVGVLAPAFGWLLAARVAQACGAAAAVVVSRVIVGDLFDPAEGGRRQASLMGVVLLSPAIAPVIGGFISDHGGWRPILGLQAVAAFATLVVATRFLPESKQPGSRPPGNLAHNYATLLRNWTFLRLTACTACATSGLYMFLSVAPFLLINRWGLSESEAGTCFLATAISAMVGTLTVKWLEKRTDTLRVGIWCGFTGAVMALVLAFATDGSWPALIGPVMLMTMGAGISAPSGTSRILHLVKGLSATAGSLAGAMQIGFSGLATIALGAVAAPSFPVLAIGMVIVTGLGVLSVPALPRADGAPTRP